MNFIVVSTEWQIAAQLVWSFSLCFVIIKPEEAQEVQEAGKGGRKQTTVISDHFIFLMCLSQQIVYQYSATQPNQTKNQGGRISPLHLGYKKQQHRDTKPRLFNGEH